MPSNPRIDDIATKVDTLQLEGYPFLSAISQVAESLDVSVVVVDACYGASLTGDYDLALEVETALGSPLPYVDPFNVNVDDWSEDFWR